MNHENEQNCKNIVKFLPFLTAKILSYKKDAHVQVVCVGVTLSNFQ